MSKVHKVVRGDRLGDISIRYYGVWARWKEIRDANPQLNGRKLIYDGSPTIYPGDILTIPFDEPELPPTQEIDFGGATDATIIVDGKKFTGWSNYEINLSYDSLDTFSFSAPADIAEKDLSSTLTPFAFKSCSVYYREKEIDRLLFKGQLLTPDPSLENTGKEITLQGYPLCGVLNDCSLPPSCYPQDYKNLTLKEIADKVVSSFNVKAIFNDAPGNPFEKAALEPPDKILDFLIKLAKERGLLVSNNKDGNLVFFKAKESGASFTLKQGERPLISLAAKFNAQDFYSHITGFSKTENEKPSTKFTYENKYLTKRGVTRYINITSGDADSVGIEDVVKSYAGRMFGGCVSYEAQCEGHTDMDGNIFYKGMTVFVNAPGAMINRDTKLLIKSVKLQRTQKEKKSVLQLVLPGSYTGNIPESMPWE